MEKSSKRKQKKGGYNEGRWGDKEELDYLNDTVKGPQVCYLIAKKRQLETSGKKPKKLVQESHFHIGKKINWHDSKELLEKNREN